MSLDYKALYTLVERESYWLRERIKSFEGKKFAIFPAGLTAQTFYYTLLNDYGIEADFFIDSNRDMEGTSIYGKPVLCEPWKHQHNYASEYVVLIPTMAKYYFQIAKQLSAVGITNYMSANAYCACQLWDRYKNIITLLDDDLSRISYLASIYDLLTCNNDFIQYVPDQYFGIKDFVSNDFEIVVDAGAYVGDTTEQYVIRGASSIKIYAFEPFEKTMIALTERKKRLIKENALNDEDIIIVPAGVGRNSVISHFKQSNPQMIRQDDMGTVDIQIYSLDDYFSNKEPFTLLKADVEGAELDMLIGAQNIIRRYTPKLAISIYHSPVDFARIVEYIRELVPQYCFKLRNHRHDYLETIVYCRIEEA